MLEKLKQVLYEEYKTNGLTAETLALSQFIDKFINNIDLYSYINCLNSAKILFTEAFPNEKFFKLSIKI